MRKSSAVLVRNDKIPSVVPKRIRYENLIQMKPLTPAQEETWKQYNAGHNLFLHGVAGTGKTFVSMFLAMEEILRRESQYEKVIVVRSTVPVRDQGFLPGDVNEKELIYQLPYQEIFKEIFAVGGMQLFEKINEQKLYQFVSTSYLRGVTFRNAIVIVDEVQNLDYSELCTVMTRIGENCKIVFSGDFRQTDLQKQSEREGLDKFMRIISNMKSFRMINFRIEDIVRSGLVKEFIETQVRLGLA